MQDQNTTRKRRRMDKQTKKWSTPPEQQTMEYMIAKRRNLQTRIEQLRKRTTIQTNKIILTEILFAWKQHRQQNKQQGTQLNNTHNKLSHTTPPGKSNNQTATHMKNGNTS